MAQIIVTEDQGDTLIEALDGLLLARSFDLSSMTPGTPSADRAAAKLRDAYNLHADVMMQITGQVPA